MEDLQKAELPNDKGQSTPEQLQERHIAAEGPPHRLLLLLPTH
jgi:hypothetical protein